MEFKSVKACFAHYDELGDMMDIAHYYSHYV